MQEFVARKGLLVPSGNVGIGTTSPAAKLDVEGNLILRNSGTYSTSLTSSITYHSNTASYGVQPIANLVFATEGDAYSSMRFATRNGAADYSERMRISPSGNVGIGTTSPSYLLDVNGGGIFRGGVHTGGSLIDGVRIGYNTTDNYGFLESVQVGTTSRPLRINQYGGLTSFSGQVCVGTLDPSVYNLKVVGGDYNLPVSIQNITTAENYEDSNLDIYFTNVSPNNTDSTFISCVDTTDARFILWTNGGIGNFQSNDVDLSDERTKNSITNLESYWDKIKNIEIVKYKYNDQSHDDYNIGVIAQQVEEIAPEFIDNNSWKIKDTEDYYKTVYNKDLQFAAIKVLQEAMIKIEKLEQELETLKNK
jgi:hypothetical protein